MKIAHDLIRDLSMYKFPDKYQYELKKTFPEVKLIEIDPLNYTNDQLLDIDAYIGDRINIGMIDKMPNLKWLHLTSVGTDKIPEDRRINGNDQIIVTNSAGIMTDAVASSALAFMFALGQGLHHNAKTRESFDTYQLPEVIFDQQVLILGRGSIAEVLINKCMALGMKVIQMKNLTPAIYKSQIYKFMDADYVINTLPLTSQTNQLIDIKAFDMMKPTAYFINVGRWQTVIEEDLIVALYYKKIAGAGLDVFKNSLLSTHTSVISTPHIAGGFTNYWTQQYNLIWNNLHEFINESDYKKYKNCVFCLTRNYL